MARKMEENIEPLDKKGEKKTSIEMKIFRKRNSRIYSF
jgi:hypothetical protein